MKSATIRRAGLWLLAAGVGVVAAVAVGAPAPTPVEKKGTFKDRSAFIPTRKHQPLPGRVIGVLVSDVVPFMSHEGRSGPPKAFGFSSGGNSYRWVYVPAEGRPLITNLTVRVGEKGDRTRNYPGLDMADPATVKRWGITVPYSLVEVQVNDGDGAPADQTFVGTSMKRLDGTRAYPLDVTDVVAKMRKRYQAYRTAQKAAIEKVLTQAQKKALKDKKPTGPRQTEELFYVTWLPESQRLSVRFRTRISDGAYEYTDVGGPGGRPVPLPLPPGKRPAGAKPAAAPRRLRPPPRFYRIRSGTTYGIEFGVAYEVNKSGKVERVLTLPYESFQSTTAPPAGRRLQVPLPPGKK